MVRQSSSAKAHNHQETADKLPALEIVDHFTEAIQLDSDVLNAKRMKRKSIGLSYSMPP